MEFIMAFLVGGAICAVGQLLLDYTQLTPARILVLFVTAGAVLTALGLYGPLVEAAGAGATTPITGFGYLMAEGVRKAWKRRDCSARSAAGWRRRPPGISAAVACGFLAAVFSRSGSKS